MDELNILKRMNYFDGYFTHAADWLDEQAYHRQRVCLHNNQMHCPGIVKGMGIKASFDVSDTLSVIVRQGLAIDPQGNELILDNDSNSATIPSGDFPSSGTQSVYILARWDALATNPVPVSGFTGSTNVEEETRIQEGVLISTMLTEPNGNETGLVVGIVTVNCDIAPKSILRITGGNKISENNPLEVVDEDNNVLKSSDDFTDLYESLSSNLFKTLKVLKIDLLDPATPLTGAHILFQQTIEDFRKVVLVSENLFKTRKLNNEDAVSYLNALYKEATNIFTTWNEVKSLIYPVSVDSLVSVINEIFETGNLSIGLISIKAAIDNHDLVNAHNSLGELDNYLFRWSGQLPVGYLRVEVRPDGVPSGTINAGSSVTITFTIESYISLDETFDMTAEIKGATNPANWFLNYPVEVIVSKILSGGQPSINTVSVTIDVPNGTDGEEATIEIKLKSRRNKELKANGNYSFTIGQPAPTPRLSVNKQFPPDTFTFSPPFPKSQDFGFLIKNIDSDDTNFTVNISIDGTNVPNSTTIVNNWSFDWAKDIIIQQGQTAPMYRITVTAHPGSSEVEMVVEVVSKNYPTQKGQSSPISLVPGS